MLSKELGNIDFSKSAKEIWCLVRGLNSWPSAYTYYNNKTMKIWRAEPVGENSDLPAGTLVRKDKESIYVQTGEGMLRILEIQLEGKKRMSVKDFMLGHSFETGIVFESEKR